MSEDVKIYEAGLRIDSGEYASFIQSRNEREVDEYISIMKKTKSENSTIVKMEKLFRCISTTPIIIET
jgi:hypothetical protein